MIKKIELYKTLIASLLFSILGGGLHGAEERFINPEIVSLEETLERFYVIQRVDPLMRLVEITPDHFWIFPLPQLDENGLLYDGCSFTNPHIIALVIALDTERSIHPLLHVWEELKRYKYLHDIKMVKEFMQLIFIITRYSFRTQLPLTFEDKILVKNVYTMDSVDMLSLEQALDVLDIIIEDMPAFLEKYELQSDLTWKEWIHKYWPVAPVAFAAFAIKVYMSYQEQHKTQVTQSSAGGVSSEISSLPAGTTPADELKA